MDRDEATASRLGRWIEREAIICLDVREAIICLDEAAAHLAEEEGLSDACRDELGALLQVLDRADERLRKHWGARVIREARQESQS